MQVQRPGTVTVVAILQLVLGTLGILCLAIASLAQFTGGGAMIQPKGPQGDAVKQFVEKIEQQQEEKMPGYHVVAGVRTGVGVILGLMMIVGGIGLLLLRTWGRNLTLVYCGLSLANHIVGSVIMFMVDIPIGRELARAAPGGGAEEKMMGGLAQMGGVIGLIIGVATSIIGIIYVIVIFVLMTRPAVTNAFRGIVTPVDEKPEYHDS